jgi:hypothetical protein
MGPRWLSTECIKLSVTGTRSSDRSAAVAWPTVFLATDTKFARRVAIKLDPELAAALGGERFHREIQIATHLTHPNILPVAVWGVGSAQPQCVGHR